MPQLSNPCASAIAPPTRQSIVTETYGEVLYLETESPIDAITVKSIRAAVDRIIRRYGYIRILIELKSIEPATNVLRTIEPILTGLLDKPLEKLALVIRSPRRLSMETVRKTAFRTFDPSQMMVAQRWIRSHGPN